MRRSYRLFQIFGIDIRIHITFLFLLGYCALSEPFESVVMICLVFGCVALHELGHSLAALHYGIPVKDITLLPIGGIARLEYMPEKPIQEFVIAVAGPAVNVLLAGIFFVLIIPASLFDFVNNFSVSSSHLFAQLLVINLSLLIFNLIPAFPMDGGRILRSLLAMRLSRLKATLIAARLGQILCMIFFGYALFNGSLILAIIAIYIFFSASTELLFAKMAHAASRLGWTPNNASSPRKTKVPSEESMNQPRRNPFPNKPFSSDKDKLPLPDVSARYKELQAQGEDVTPVISNGRIVGIIRNST